MSEAASISFCAKCKTEKPTSAFTWIARRKDGRKPRWSSYCKPCQVDIQREVRKKARARMARGEKIPEDIPETKKCGKCGVEKPAAAFWKKLQYGRVKLQEACSECKRAASRAWHKSNPEKARSRNVAYRRRLKVAADVFRASSVENLDALRRSLVDAPRELSSEDERAAYFRGFVAGAKRTGYESDCFEKLKDLCHRIASEMSKMGKAGYFQSYEDNLGVAYEGLLAFIRKRKSHENDEHERRSAAMAIRSAIMDYARRDGPFKRTGRPRYEQNLIPVDDDGGAVDIQTSPDEPWRDDGLKDSLEHLDLDPRSKVILEGLAAGVNCRELGEKLGISESRVFQIVAEIREKHGERLLAVLT